MLLFSGYISMNIALISNDVACTIYNYFNCYNTKKYDFVLRLFYLLDAKNRYHDDIRNISLKIIRYITGKCDDGTARLLLAKYNMIMETKKDR